MPTYEYECKSCSHKFEILQSMSDPPLTTCPECGKDVRRLIGGGAGIIFKGSGFYVTDSKKGSSGSPAKPSNAAETKSTGEAASAGTEKTKTDSGGSAPEKKAAAVKSSA
ncbi:MAG: hypothetical protein FWG35_02060 [Spirochaetaceae bacterium]|nr:hypothetical protein [Spirochaetaceae bacterium]